MKSLEEIKAEITNNSYSVELSNGQTVYVDRITSNKTVFVYIKDEKNPQGFKKVVSVPQSADKELVIERIEEYADNIEMPSLINYSTTSECNQACAALIQEIADAILNEPVVEDIFAEIETGEVYERFQEEIEELKQLDIELYNTYLAGVYHRKKQDEDLDFPFLTDFSFSHHNIIYLVNKLSQTHDIKDIVRRIDAKWDMVKDIDD